MTAHIDKPPLAGVRVVEIAGLGPAPLAGLMLAELGATVIRVEPPAKPSLFGLDPAIDLDRQGRHILKLDLKDAAGKAALIELAAAADMLIEGLRPGAMERLGLGPDDLVERNPRLIYGRMTGFGQEGPLARSAGHDLTYLAYSGVLSAIGRAGERPVIPLNLIGDYGGGTMFLLVGLLAALIERERSGKGQVIDAAMVDGVSMLAATLTGYIAQGKWCGGRGENLLDGGVPFYDTYQTADGEYLAVACLEPQFFAEFARLLPLDKAFVARQHDRSVWPEMRAAIAEAVAGKTRDEWATLFEPTDACVAPVLGLSEAPDHPHNAARGLYVRTDAMRRPAPAPRFGRSQQEVAGPPVVANEAALAAFGLDPALASRILASTQD